MDACTQSLLSCEFGNRRSCTGKDPPASDQTQPFPTGQPHCCRQAAGKHSACRSGDSLASQLHIFPSPVLYGPYTEIVLDAWPLEFALRVCLHGSVFLSIFTSDVFRWCLPHVLFPWPFQGPSGPTRATCLAMAGPCFQWISILIGLLKSGCGFYLFSFFQDSETAESVWSCTKSIPISYFSRPYTFDTSYLLSFVPHPTLSTG